MNLGGTDGIIHQARQLRFQRRCASEGGRPATGAGEGCLTLNPKPKGSMRSVIWHNTKNDRAEPGLVEDSTEL